jgi:hypothetical protein
MLTCRSREAPSTHVDAHVLARSEEFVWELLQRIDAA